MVDQVDSRTWKENCILSSNTIFLGCRVFNDCRKNRHNRKLSRCGAFYLYAGLALLGWATFFLILPETQGRWGSLTFHQNFTQTCKILFTQKNAYIASILPLPFVTVNLKTSLWGSNDVNSMIYCCNNVVLCANYRLYNAEPWKKTATALPPIFSTNMAIMQIYLQ